MFDNSGNSVVNFDISFPLQQPQIILLKEGTDSSQGIPQLISNINACEVVADAIRTTLGPRGMDKLVVDSGGECHSQGFSQIKKSNTL